MRSQSIGGFDYDYKYSWEKLTLGVISSRLWIRRPLMGLLSGKSFKEKAVARLPSTGRIMYLYSGTQSS